MSDVVESLLVMESDRTTPQTPPLMETRPWAPTKSTPYVRHRKTSSGLWNLDMEKLMAFPVEALPPDEEVDLSHHLSDKLRAQDCMKVDVGQEINTRACPLERQTTSESDCSDGVDTTDGGSISWPPTPSCGSYQMKIGDDYYDSDQETVIEDEEPSSAESASEEDFETMQKEWDMGCTLLGDEVLEEFPFSFDFSSPFPDSGSDRELPDYVGIAPDSALMSIPEDSEVCLDKTGKHVSVEGSSSTVTVHLECIEHDAAEYMIDDTDDDDNSNNDDKFEDKEEEAAEVTGMVMVAAAAAAAAAAQLRSQKETGLLFDNTGRMSANQTDVMRKSIRRPVRHEEAVEAILAGSTNLSRQQMIIHRHQARHSKHATVTDFSDLLLYRDNSESIDKENSDNNDNDDEDRDKEDDEDEDEDDDVGKKLEVACEVVLSDMNGIVRSATGSKRFLQSVKDGKASVGCCAGLRRMPSFGKARRRIEAIGRVLKKHWPVITSAVVPIVLFFSCRSNK